MSARRGEARTMPGPSSLRPRARVAGFLTCGCGFVKAPCTRRGKGGLLSSLYMCTTHIGAVKHPGRASREPSPATIRTAVLRADHMPGTMDGLRRASGIRMIDATLPKERAGDAGARTARAPGLHSGGVAGGARGLTTQALAKSLARRPHRRSRGVRGVTCPPLGHCREGSRRAATAHSERRRARVGRVQRR